MYTFHIIHECEDCKVYLVQRHGISVGSVMENAYGQWMLRGNETTWTQLTVAGATKSFCELALRHFNRKDMVGI